jgi:hypothetical protein
MSREPNSPGLQSFDVDYRVLLGREYYVAPEEKDRAEILSNFSVAKLMSQVITCSPGDGKQSFGWILAC